MGIFKQQNGFTIIETTLFLAISGLLVLMIVAGTGTSINAQRYREAVETFKSVLQQQYSDLSNVQNGRDNNWSCNSSADVTKDGSNDKIRGQSNCFLIGKYVRIDGSDMVIYKVVASAKSNQSVQPNDIAALSNNYNINISTTATEQRPLDWGTQIAWAKAGPIDVKSPTTPRKLGILFVRSPDSGFVYTFTSDSVPDKSDIGPSTFTNLLVAGATVPGQAPRAICIESGGMLVSGDMDLYISQYATSASAIETRSNDVNKSLGGDGATQC